MSRTAQDNAAEFKSLDQGEGWPFARLVACSVEMGAGNGRPSKTVTRVTVSGKMSARQFAREAGTSTPRISRYLDCWQRAAAQGVVPNADTLSPSDVEGMADPPISWLLPNRALRFGDGKTGGLPKVKADAGDVVREQSGEALVSALTPHQQLEVRRALNKRDQDRVETMRLENEKFGKHVKRDDIDATTRRINPRHPDADVLSDMTSPGAVGRVIDRAGALLHSAGLHWSDVDIEERDHVRERIRMVRVEVGVLEMYAFDIIPGMDEEP